jgi:hypothetical protein
MKLFLVACISTLALASQNSTTSSLIVREFNLPGIDSHEFVKVPGEDMIIVTHMGNSALVKVSLDKNGIVTGAKDHQIGTDKSGMHGISPSKVHRGHIWLTLEHDNKVVLIDPKPKSIDAAPKIIREIKLPDQARGPHYVGEYGDYLWLTLRESKHVMKLSHFNESNYELFQASEPPIFVSPSSSNNLFYASLLRNSKILKIDPSTKLTEEISIPSNHGIFPVGLIPGPNGAWFTLLGDKNAGTGTFGFIDKESNIKYFKLKSELGKDASLIHLNFDNNTDKSHVLWILGSSSEKKDAIDMVIRVDMDSSYSNIINEEYIVLPTQRSISHRLLVDKNLIYVTELSSRKLAIVESKKI